MEDPFDTLKAKDGFHVIRVDVGGHTSLHAQVYAGDEIVDPGDFLLGVQTDQGTVEIREWRDATPADDGAASRLHMALEAACRYLNTGGQWYELMAALQVLHRVAPGGLVFPGYHYSDAYPQGDGTYEHLFVKDDGSGSAVLWEEPGYTERGDGIVGGDVVRTTLDELKKQQEEDGWGEPETEDAEEAGGDGPAPPLLGLRPQDRDGPEAQNGPEGNTGV